MIVNKPSAIFSTGRERMARPLPISSQSVPLARKALGEDPASGAARKDSEMAGGVKRKRLPHPADGQPTNAGAMMREPLTTVELRATLWRSSVGWYRQRHLPGGISCCKSCPT